MKLITYRYLDATRVGALVEGDTQVRPLPYPDMNTLIETCPLAELPAVVAAAAEPTVPLADVTLLAPIPRPRQDLVCLGMNYRDHQAESARYDSSFTREKEEASYFSKRVGRAVDPDGFILSHQGFVERLDYENELAVIIGKPASQISREDAADYIFGYTIVNDVSARDIQTHHKQWFFGKSLEGFAPMGPCILTADEVAFPPALKISTTVNGELRQNSCTDRFIYPLAEVLEELSAGFTLLPGTILITGTPAGVGMGFDPPRFLKPGDVVECTIEGIGTLKNTVQ